MKHFMIFMTLFVFCAAAVQAQTVTDLSKIEAAVRQFSAGGDKQDVAVLDKVLHPQFRAVVNRAFGSPDLSLMDKSLYLQLMKDKKIGGDQREVYLLQTDIGENTALVKAIFHGKSLRFTTFISLVKLPTGEWQIVGDMPEIVKV
jgi:Putative lumazine-binding